MPARTADQMAAAEGEMNGMVAGPLFQVKSWIEQVGAEHCTCSGLLGDARC